MNFKYFLLNIARPLIFSAGPFMCYIYGFKEGVLLGIIIIVLSFFYAIFEAVLDLTNKYPITSYLATFFDITGCMFFCYLSGMDSFIFGAFVYIVSLCALNLRTRQAEFAVVYTASLHFILVMLLLLKIIPYINIVHNSNDFNLYSIILSFIIVNMVVFFSYKIVRGIVKKNASLLKCLLPEKVISIIEEKSNYTPQMFQNATVVFTDFCDFTMSTKNVDPHVIVESLEKYFLVFDEIIKKYDLTRLKTIGDGYMFVSGIPEENINNVEQACKAALEILEYVKKEKEIQSDLLSFDIRIGIANGPVVAAVLGKNRISFDVWSPVVNLASRLESSATPGAIYICHGVHSNINKILDTSYVGEKELKGLGKNEIFQLIVDAQKY